MLSRLDLPDVLHAALKSLGGSARIVDVCKYVWDNYESELRNSNKLFYTWQYDIRWAATKLRKNKTMKSAKLSPTGLWELQTQ